MIIVFGGLGVVVVSKYFEDSSIVAGCLVNIFWILWVYMHNMQMHDIYFYSIGHHSENS